jgi:hypothetical protein
VVSTTDPYGRILFSWPESLLFFQVAPQLYSRGCVKDSVPDPLLLRIPGSVGDRTRTSGSVARNTDN